MLFPGDGIDGIKRFLLDTLVAFGKRGLACQPAIVGVGIDADVVVEIIVIIIVSSSSPFYRRIREVSTRFVP